ADRFLLRGYHHVPHVRGHLLSRVSHQPVLPIRARGHPAGDRAAVLALDRHPAGDRAARGRSVGPDRPARAHRAGPAVAGRGLRGGGGAEGTGRGALSVPGLLLEGAGFAWIVSLAGSSAGYGSYVLPFVVAGVGISMALPCVTAGGLNAAPPALLGKAAGTLNT